MQVLPARRSSIAAGSMLFRPTASTWRLVVVAKLTFDLEPGVCRLRTEPQPLVARERRRGGNGLVAPVDLVPFKHQPEFVVVGPPKTSNGAAGEPLVVAVDVDGQRKEVTVRRHAEATMVDDLAPIPARAPVRQTRLGALARSWSDDDLQARVLGEDFDRRYFQTAPSDQWLNRLTANAALRLEHLSAKHPRLVTKLPGVEPVARVERDGAEPEPLPLVADTLVIDSDGGCVTVTWRGRLELERPDEAGHVRLGVRAGGELTWDHSTEDSEPDLQSITTLRLDDRQADQARQDARRARRPTLDVPRYQGEEGTAEAAVRLDPTGPGWLARGDRKDSPSSRPPPPPPRLDAPPPTGWSDGKRGSVAPPNPARELLGEPAPEPVTPTQSEPAPKPEPSQKQATTGPVELVWRAEDAAERIEAEETLAKLLPARPEPPVRKKPKRGEAPAPPPPPPDPRDEERRAQRAVAIAVGKAALTPIADLESRVFQAFEDDASEPPLVVVGGMLKLAFDEAEALTITCQLAKPVATRHKPLAEAIELAQSAADALVVTPAMARPLRRRVEEAWAKGNRDLPPSYLEDGVRRALLEKRAYRKVTLLGLEVIVCFIDDQDRRPLPAYVPAEASDFLPLYTSFDARLLAHVLPKQDEAEKHPLALRALALGRRVAIGPG